MNDIELDLPYGKPNLSGPGRDYNRHGFRTDDFSTKDHTKPIVLAFGDSHTAGAGNHRHEIWAEQLKEKIGISQIFNMGQGGCSSDYMVRIMPKCLDYFKPEHIFVLWADHGRFEHNKDGTWKQSLPTFPDRIYFMETATDQWLLDNFNEKVQLARNLCAERNIKMFDMTLYDLMPVIDHADKWPIARNGTHFNQEWHSVVAEIFARKFRNDPPLTTYTFNTFK